MPLKDITQRLQERFNNQALNAPSAVIDEHNRKVAAWQVRQYLERLIELENMVDDWPIDPDLTEQQDAAVLAIGTFLKRFIDDPETREMLTTDTGITMLQRCYHFLNGTLPYEWPVVNFTPLIPQPWYIHLATLGLSYWWEQRASAFHEDNINSMINEPSFKHWPFQWESDYADFKV